MTAVRRRSPRAACASTSGCCDSRYHVQLRRAGGRLVPGDHQRHHLIDQLALLHRVAGFLVAGVHQHADVVEVLFVPLAAAARRAPPTSLVSERNLKANCRLRALLLGHDLEGVAAGLLRQAVEVRAEDRSQHDLERELAHVVGEVHELAAGGLRLPAGDEALVAASIRAANSVITRRWNIGCIM